MGDFIQGLSARIQMASDMIGRGQWSEAERLLKEVVQSIPDLSLPHSMLAQVYVATKRFDEAEEEVKVAIAAAPHDSVPQLVLATLHQARNRFSEAEQAFNAAIDLDPNSSNAFALYASFLVTRKRWNEALEMTEQALLIDPENTDALQSRSMALSMLGRVNESHESIAEVMRRSPNDSNAHATLGWSLLQRNQPKESMPHFREALRLDPNSEFARLGILEAMRAKFLLYRLLLMYFMWMSRFQTRYAMVIIIALYVGVQFLAGLNDRFPEWSFIITPLIFAYAVIALSSWIAHPVMNVLLMLHPFGRLALTTEEQRISRVVFVLLGLAFLIASVGIWLDFLSLFILAISLVALITLVSNYYNCLPGAPRYCLIGLMSLVAITGLCWSVPLLFGELHAKLPIIILLPAMIAFKVANSVGWIVFAGSQFLVNLLMTWEPRQ